MTLKAHNNLFELFKSAATLSDKQEAANRLIAGGYSAFSEFLHDFKAELKQCSEATMESINQILNDAKTAIPNPGSISPSWTYIWGELEETLNGKQEVLNQVPREQREGEWLVLLDNPYLNDGRVCYPGLSFIEAAYLYAYFKSDLKANEYVRLHKVENVLMAYGKKQL